MDALLSVCFPEGCVRFALQRAVPGLRKNVCSVDDATCWHGKVWTHLLSCDHLSVNLSVKFIHHIFATFHFETDSQMAKSALIRASIQQASSRYPSGFDWWATWWSNRWSEQLDWLQCPSRRLVLPLRVPAHNSAEIAFRWENIAIVWWEMVKAGNNSTKFMQNE